MLKTNNNTQNSFSLNTEPQALITDYLNQTAESGKTIKDANISFVQLSQIIKKIQEQTNPSSAKSGNNKLVKMDFTTPVLPQAASSQAPSISQMQEMIGRLMETLAELQGMLAKHGNEVAQITSAMSLALIQNMQNQLKTLTNELQQASKEANTEKFWNTFLKDAGVVAGFVAAGVAAMCGQPEIAAVIIVFTVLSASGAMDKITTGLTKLYVEAGCSPTVAKVLADVTVIVVAALVTGGACAAYATYSAGAVATEAAAENATADAAEDGITVAADSGESATEDADLAAESAKSESPKTSWNPFRKLPRSVNIGIVAGSQATMSTNFASDFMSAALINMKDGKTKDWLQTIGTIIINFLAALAGIGAASAASAAGSRYSLLNANNSKIMSYALQGTQAAGSCAQITGQVGLGITYINQANNKQKTTQTEAAITLLNSFTKIISQMETSNSKTSNSEMKTWSTELSALSYDLNRAGAEIARELQA